MKLYIAILQDRHTDVLVRVFRKPESAIAFCESFMAENIWKHSKIEEQEIDGWLYYATYSSEGDSVRVEQAELDKP